MNLHEYQAKSLMAQYGIPVPKGFIVTNATEAKAACDKLGGSLWVVKAQVHAGGRGKAGGVVLLRDKQAVADKVTQMIGTRLVTIQTDATGQPINSVWIEEASDIANELYISAVIDRSSSKIVFMASTEGGMEIEEVAEHSPEKIHTITVEPMVGMQPFQARQLFFKLNCDISLLRPFTDLVMSLYKMFMERDLALLEINPLVVTKQGGLICLDGKITIDANALYRQEQLVSMRDPSQEDDKENKAAEWNLNYISLDGNIGCMVNGAGLAMATMDLIKLNGGDPANFLDVGGSATEERVTEAFKIITSDPNIKGILVNIFGGIVRCDMIAEGIMKAVKQVGIKVPVVVRLEGNNAELGATLLKNSGLNILPAEGFAQAAQLIVKAVNQ
jgi:succinyl-CoA synthetase beta subunit